MKKRVYMKVTPDKYELPLAIADTPDELARLCGVARNTVLSVISHTKQHKSFTTYKKVMIDDD